MIPTHRGFAPCGLDNDEAQARATSNSQMTHRRRYRVERARRQGGSSPAAWGYSASLFWLPGAANLVRRKRFVSADNLHFLYGRLRNDKPVERVAVMKRQPSLLIEMLRFDREHLDGIAHDVLANEPRKWKRHLELSEAHLDGHLPKAGHTEVALVARVFDQPFSMRAELIASANEPEKGVRVEKQSHEGM